MYALSKIFIIPTYMFVEYEAPSPKNFVDMAFGKAIDTAISQYNYYSQKTSRPLLREAMKCAMAVFSLELKSMEVEMDWREFRVYAGRLWRMICCWAKSRYAEMLRPKTHVILLEKEGVMRGVFAQPDFKCDEVYYEVKSFSIEEEKLGHVEVQAKVFSLLGELKLVYFVEENGYYNLKETDVEKSVEILEELWEYLALAEEKMLGKHYLLEDLLFEHPTVKYVYKNNSWTQER